MHFSLKIYQQIFKTIRRVLLVVVAMVLVEVGYGQCKSNSTGDWNVASSWDCGWVTSSTDDVEIRSGYTVTYTGNLNWDEKKISIDGGTLIVGGDIDKAKKIEHDNGTIEVGGNVFAEEVDSKNTGSFISIGDNLTVDNKITIDNNNLVAAGKYDVDRITNNGGAACSGGVRLYPIITPKNSYIGTIGTEIANGNGGTNEGSKFLTNSENKVHFYYKPAKSFQFAGIIHLAFAFINHINARGL
ncbi:MAG: hypothetical protein PF486_00195 [Prolixibacteraceae bacterium]|nr:hypothetical protein [Prolixibacteraceae bacterium]